MFATTEYRNLQNHLVQINSNLNVTTIFAFENRDCLENEIFWFLWNPLKEELQDHARIQLNKDFENENE